MKRCFMFSFLVFMFCQVVLTQSPCDDPPVIDTAIVTPNPCIGSAKASIVITVTGGTRPYSYTWIGPNDFVSNDSSIYNLYRGCYFLTLRDANGCALSGVQSDSIYILFDDDPIIMSFDTSNYNGYNVSVPGAYDGWIKINNGTGNGSYLDWTYRWEDESGYTYPTKDINYLQAGEYILELWDTAGCFHSDTIILKEPPFVNIYTDTVYVYDTIWETFTDTVFEFKTGCTITFVDNDSEPYLNVTQIDDILYLSREVQEVWLYDLTGNLRLNQQYLNQVDIHELNSGIYLMKIHVPEIGILYTKFVYIY